MIIKGLQKTTLLDYPGRVAATVFLGGCNMRCPFCHNMDIVEGGLNEDDYTVEEVLEFLKRRKSVLEGVCITGGEPTLSSELPDFIRNIKALGYKVKLDTNGTNPQMVRDLYAEGLIDYVAMDIKSSADEYKKVCGNQGINFAAIKESIDFLIKEKPKKLDYEFRTTIVCNYHNKEVMEDIGKLIEGADRYFLQNFVDSEYVLNHDLLPATKEMLEEFSEVVSSYVKHVSIRGEM